VVENHHIVVAERIALLCIYVCDTKNEKGKSNVNENTPFI
jgi:hypothetical protein